MKNCKNCTEKEALFQFAIERANECAKLKSELAKAKDAICEAVYRSWDKSHAVTPYDTRAEFFRMRAEQLAYKLREKDMELAQKDATIRELQGKLEVLQSSKKKEEQQEDFYSLSRRFIESLFSSANGSEEGEDA